MTESEYTSNVVAYLKNNGCVVFKHCDHFTTGTPDVSCTVNKYSTWLEMKILKPGETFFGRVTKKKDKTQFFNMVALGTAGRAMYVLKKDRFTMLVHPSVFIRMSLALGDMSDEYITGIAKPAGVFLQNHFRERTPVIMPSTAYSEIFKLVTTEGL